jgi:HSP20 family protein
MTLIKHHDTPRLEAFDRFFGQWPDIFRHPLLVWPGDSEDTLRVDEYQENGTRVIRAEMAGIDPDKDVEVTVSDGLLHISAERKEEAKSETKDYARHEIHYGSFTRVLPLPDGCAEADVQATYKNGILEIRVPVPSLDTKASKAKKVPVTKG